MSWRATAENKLFQGKSSNLFCQLCGKIKNPKTFYRYVKSRGLRNICKECWAKRRTNSEESAKRHQWLYSFHGRFINAKKEALQNNHSWTLVESEYSSIASRSCHYCGRLSASSGSGLDRIDNSRGYELGNVLPACGECNRVRSNRYTVEETKAMIQALMIFRTENTIRQDILVGKYYL